MAIDADLAIAPTGAEGLGVAPEPDRGERGATGDSTPNADDGGVDWDQVASFYRR